MPSSRNNYYNKRLKPFAREHRNDSTKAEIRLWCELLRNKQMLGYSFLRQRPVDHFITDFFCKALNLIIEADGVTHEEKIAEDRMRDKRLFELGYTTLRFTDHEITFEIEIVKEKIEKWIQEWEKNHPTTPFDHGQTRPQGER